MTTIRLQSLVAQRVSHLGAAGQRWVDGLPALIADLEDRWSITVGEPLPGGSGSYVTGVRTALGEVAVLKIALPGPGFADQVRTIEAAQGRGYVRLLAHDLEQHSMLLEALGPSIELLSPPTVEQLAALADTLRLAWQVPRPEGMAAHDKAGQLHELVSRQWKQLNHPCPEPVVAQALEFAERRAAAFDPEECVVVHGDPHPANALQVATPRAGAESGYVFVDPDGFCCDRAYDLGVVLRDWGDELLAGDARATAERYCHLLAGHTGVDEQRIWEWGYLERVSTGLYVTQIGAEEMGRRFLDSAAAIISPDG